MVKIEKENVVLKVDDREDEKIFSLLQQPRFKDFINTLKIELTITKQRLLVGDFVAGDICIERKSFADFVGSIRSKHLYEQILNMKQNYNYNYILISGNIKDCCFNPYLQNYTVNEFVGSIASLLARFNAKIFIVNNDTQLLKLALKLIEKHNSSKDIGIIKKMVLNDQERALSTILCCKGIGEDRAKVIMKKYPKISDLCKATSDELMEIEGIGKTLAKNIKDVFI